MLLHTGQKGYTKFIAIFGNVGKIIPVYNLIVFVFAELFKAEKFFRGLVCVSNLLLR